MWCVPVLDKEYIRRMEDILDLYDRPHCKREPVLCIDEKPVQLLADVRQGRTIGCGRIRRRDYEYRRQGVVNVFCALEPKAARHFNRVTKNRSGREFAKLMGSIARRYPRARRIHAVLDNLSTHSEKSMVDFYGTRAGRRLWRRFEIHWTPKHGSWLNQAEIEVSLVSSLVLGSRRIPTQPMLRDEINAFNDEANRKSLTIDWEFTKMDARRVFGYKRNFARSRH